MEFRKSTKSDVIKIMEIVKQAQEYFKSQGIDQWQNGYPNEEVINNDIENGVHCCAFPLICAHFPAS